VCFFSLVVFSMPLRCLSHEDHGQHTEDNGLDETNEEF
jgi:hypothetical protein